MRNKDLIHSIAQSIIEKHYDFEDECENDDDEGGDFFSMFEAGPHGEEFWDTSPIPAKEIRSNSLIYIFITLIAFSTIPVSSSQPFAVGLTYFMLAVLVSGGIFANRMKLYSRNLFMVGILSIAVVLSTIAYAATVFTLLVSIFSG